MGPPLKPLHDDSQLSKPKLAKFAKLTTKEILESLAPGSPESLKARPDGTILNGHHRIRVLRDRGIDVDCLPREIVRPDHD